MSLTIIFHNSNTLRLRGLAEKIYRETDPKCEVVQILKKVLQWDSGGSLILKGNGPPLPSKHFNGASLKRYKFCVGHGRDFGKCMGVIVKIGKTNTMANTWGKTKTKTDKDKKMEKKDNC